MHSHHLSIYPHLKHTALSPRLSSAPQPPSSQPITPLSPLISTLTLAHPPFHSHTPRNNSPHPHHADIRNAQNAIKPRGKKRVSFSFSFIFIFDAHRSETKDKLMVSCISGHANDAEKDVGGASVV